METKLEALKAHLRSNPQIAAVYFNDQGEWLFKPSEKFPNCVSREEVLSQEAEAEEEDKKETVLMEDYTALEQELIAVKAQLKVFTDKEIQL